MVRRLPASEKSRTAPAAGKPSRPRSAKAEGKLGVMTPTKTNVVYSDLRERIMRGELPPGQRIVIRHVADRHGVSDIPVREALRLLEKDNLIVCQPYGSAVVREASDEEIYELFFIRGLLEGAATQLCVNFISEVTLRKLESLCEQMELCTRAKDVQEYSRFNREFHRSIFGMLPFNKLIGQIESLWQSYGWLQLSLNFAPGRMAVSNAEHRVIVEALRNRDMVAAGKAAFTHKQTARAAFVEARRHTGSGDRPAGVNSAEEIEVLCQLWQETQWPSRGVASGASAVDAVRTATRLAEARGKNSARAGSARKANKTNKTMKSNKGRKGKRR